MVMENIYRRWLLVYVVLCWASIYHSLPLSDNDDELSTNSTDNVNDTAPQDLLVIRTVVYEIGILTDAANDTSDNSTEISHQVDLTFFDPKLNGGQIDLSNFPVPIQTNISGITVTGVAPLNLGTFSIPPPGDTTVQQASDLPLNVPIIPNAVVSVTHNVSTTDPEKGSLFVSGLPDILGLRHSATEASNSEQTQQNVNDVNTSDEEVRT